MATFNPTHIRQEVTAALATDTDSGSGAAATITYPAVVERAHAITEGIAWSYDTTPTGGGLTVTAGGVTVFSLDIATAGAGFIPLRKAANLNSALVVTLASGGGAVVGKVNVLGYARIKGAPLGTQGVFDFSDYRQSGLVAVI